MTYLSRDLTEPCTCAAMRDTMWFLSNPARTRHLRVPWACEEAAIDPAQRGLVSQLVAVVTAKSLDQLAAENNHLRGIINVPLQRRSFLFWGKPELARTDASDEAVLQFLHLIDDHGDGPGWRPN